MTPVYRLPFTFLSTCLYLVPFSSSPLLSSSLHHARPMRLGSHRDVSTSIFDLLTIIAIMPPLSSVLAIYIRLP